MVVVCASPTESFVFSTDIVRARRQARSDRVVFQRRRCPNNAVTVVRSSDNNNNNEFDASAKLTSALARLDSEWQVRQQKAPNKLGQWRKVVIRADDGTASEEEDFVYLLPPPATTTPSLIVLFVGGAGLGQFPHIAYDELLQRLARRTNAAVLAAPYQASLDHFGLAKRTQILLEKALLQCDEDSTWGDSSSSSSNIPKYCLSHSLGSKLQLISMAASSSSLPYDARGIGLMAYNNFGVAGSLGMAKTLLGEFQSSRVADAFGTPPNANNAALDTIFGLAETALNMSGLEFTPSPSQMEELVRRKITADLVRVFRFDDDQLDSAASLRRSCADAPQSLQVAGLPGSHLTPVFLAIGLDDLDFDESLKDVVATQLSDGLRGASFGSEEDLDGLVDELYNWVVGKPVTRAPRWTTEEQEDTTRTGNNNNSPRGPPRAIAGQVVDAEIE